MVINIILLYFNNILININYCTYLYIIFIIINYYILKNNNYFIF